MPSLREIQFHMELRNSALFPQCKDWSVADWLMALIGELGETANILKKVQRGDFTLDEAIEDHGLELEFGDVLSYFCLLASKCDVDLEQSTTLAYNKVCKRKNREDLMLKIEGKI